MRRKTITFAALLAALGVGAAACSHSSGGAASRAGNQAAHAPVASAAAGPALAPGLANSGVSSGRDAAAVQNLVEQQQIRTAQLTVAVKGAGHVARQADAAAAIAARMGGEVTRDDRTSGRHASALLVLRVPPAQLEPALQALSRLGTEKSRQVSTIDVTQRVADVASRVASARAAIVQLRALYNRAVKVRDIISIENQLASREADLESLQARARALANRTVLATITLQLVTAAKPKPKPVPAKHYSGFIGGLERGWHAFTTALAWLAVALGALLPFLVLAALLALLAWQWRRRARPRPSPPLH